jgi:hypothetical protein
MLAHSKILPACPQGQFFLPQGLIPGCLPSLLGFCSFIGGKKDFARHVRRRANAN